ncbi:hypothetical protein GALL_470560 [mine drainage metagenome]|uniref:Uncharacterized protein n=1 Tax=mine drainage metagenome TaxID=410659 RepID=A0A1J5PKJ4_9ZZZZ
MDAEEQTVDAQRAECGHRERPDQRVGRRAGPAGQHHVETGARRAVQGLGDGQGVRHDRQRTQGRGLGDQCGEQVGRRSCGQRDRRVRLDEGERCARDRLLLPGGPGALRLETRLVARATALRRVDGAAVHTPQQTRLRELADVPADGHVGDAEALDQVGDADRTAGAHHRDDLVLALPGEHVNSIAHKPTNSHIDSARPGDDPVAPPVLERRGTIPTGRPSSGRDVALTHP